MKGGSKHHFWETEILWLKEMPEWLESARRCGSWKKRQEWAGKTVDTRHKSHSEHENIC